MVQTIGNPGSWGARQISGAGHLIAGMTRSIRSESAATPEIARIGLADIRAALRAGLSDYTRFRSDVAASVLLYPVLGVALAYMAFHQSLLHLIFPLAAGFALLGPVVAVLFYELSRQAEAGGEDVGWLSAFRALTGARLAPVIVLGLYLFAVFLVWMAAAHAIYLATMAPLSPAGNLSFFRDALTTDAGWQMIAIGCAVGFLFAVLVLLTAAFSFPALIDGAPGLPVAVATSLRVARRNPGAVALWGLIVAVLLVIGSLPFFLGLILVLPWLGHATWHLYRRAVPGGGAG